MNTPYDLAKLSANIVYIKTIEARDLPQDIRDQANGAELLYSVHDAEGEQVAIVAHPSVAVQIAAQNNLEAVSVH